jgi:hypothetical protein
MEVRCKQYYPYENDDKMIIFQSYLTGHTYKAGKIFHENEIWYHIDDECNHQNLFSPNEFDEYFYSISKHRKEKLKKIMKE